MSGFYEFNLPQLILFFIVKFTVASQKCGRPLGAKVSATNDRIVGGYDVGYYKYPWYAALIQDRMVSCGGSLIGPRTVLTAAHCYKPYLGNNRLGVKLENVYEVRLGMYNICISESTVTEFAVAKVQVHELYMSKKPYFDIALITLQNSADQYEPLCLPTGGISRRPLESYAPGMGTLRYHGPMPCSQHEARLLIYPDSTCSQMLANSGNNPKDMKYALCAGYLTGGIDTCQGDSGGPLQIIGKSGQYILLGIVSFGFDCAAPGRLGVYTDASKFLQWIRDKSGSDLQFINSFTSHSDNEESSGDKPWHHVQYQHKPIRIIILKNGNHKQSGRHWKINRP